MTGKFELLEFFIDSKNSGGSHSVLHISEPPPGNHDKGQFFAICELDKPKRTDVLYWQSLVSEIENAYYESKPNEEGNSFELALDYINRQHSLSDIPKTDIRCLVGAFEDGKLFLASFGEMYCSLFYQQGGSHCHHIISTSGDKKRKTIFSSVVEGSLNSKDVMLVAGSNVSNQFPPDKLDHLLALGGVEKTRSSMIKKLTQLRSNDSFAGIFFAEGSYTLKKSTNKLLKLRNNQEKEDEEESGHSRVEGSMSRLYKNTLDTEETLSPPILSGFKNSLKVVQSKTISGPQRKTKGGVKRNDAEDFSLLAFLGKSFVIGLVGIILTIKNILVRILSLLRTIFFLVTNYKGGRKLVIRQVSEKFHDIYAGLRSLPPISKAFFAGAIILTILFFGSLTQVRIKERQKLQEQEFSQIVQKIQEKRDAAQSNLVYSNEETALRLLQEATSYFEDLVPDTDVQQKRMDDLKSEIENLLKAQRKEIVLDSSVVATLEEKAHTLSLLGTDLITTYRDKREHLFVDSTNGSVRRFNHDTFSKVNSAISEQDPTIEYGTIAFFIGDNRIAVLDTDTGLLKGSELFFNEDGVSASIASIYGSRLYSFDKVSGNIYRHNATQTGYNKGHLWTTEKHNKLDDVVDIAIDGSVYILTSKGEVFKFVKGKQSTYSISGADPVLENSLDIWTSVNTDYIYVLDANNPRVLVFAKSSGKLVKQFVSDAWEKPTNFVIDNDIKNIYLVDGTKLHKAKLK